MGGHLGGASMHMTPRDQVAPVPQSDKVCGGCDQIVPNYNIRYVTVRAVAPAPGISATTMRLLVCKQCQQLYHGAFARTDPRTWDRERREQILRQQIETARARGLEREQRDRERLSGNPAPH